MVIMFTHAAFDGKLWPRPLWPFVFVNLNFNAITVTSSREQNEQNRTTPREHGFENQ